MTQKKGFGSNTSNGNFMQVCGAEISLTLSTKAYVFLSLQNSRVGSHSEGDHKLDKPNKISKSALIEQKLKYHKIFEILSIN